MRRGRFPGARGYSHRAALHFGYRPVLILGEGQIHLDSEALDLSFRGEPKRLRSFCLRSPVLLRGTLSDPAIDVGSRRALQAIHPRPR